MRPRIGLHGSSEIFIKGLRSTIEDCGMEAAGPGEAVDLAIYEVMDDSGLDAVGKGRGREGVRPYLVYSRTGLDAPGVHALKQSGLVGVLTEDTPPEEVYFLVNKALFYGKTLKRKPRSPVDIPVEVRTGATAMKARATLLSMDGMFVVTLNPLPVNSLCALSFAVPGIRRTFGTKARVLYTMEVNRDLNIISSPQDPFRRLVAHPGMAVFFVDMPAEDRELIDGYVLSLE
jgi:hypothetical protein